ncbi:MAG: hypothetical protein JKY37_20405 [Nannocystaceae bacterium]|nr:hypothetical protein [Nannocystaceae bacterium]
MFKVHPNLVFLLVGCSIGVLAGTSCRRAIPDHCSSLNGDYTCRDRGSGMYCNACWTSDEVFDNEGCTDVMPSSDCRYEGVPDDAGSSTTGGGTDDGPTTGDSGDTTDGLTTDTGETGTGTESGSSTTGPTPCTGPEDCTEVTAPYCGDEGLCVACSEAPTAEEGDAACAAADELAPACNPDGTCVSCTSSNVVACEGVTPLCDTDAETCVGCTQHDQCPDSACHIPSLIAGADDPDDGACFAVESVMHVDGDGARDFTTLNAAVNAVDDDAQAVLIVHDWSGNYDEQVTVDGGKSIVFLAADDETPNWIQGSNTAGTNPNLRIEDSATVFLHRMLINANNDPDGPGIEVNGARLHAQRSRIINNSGGGVGATGSATVELENCFVSASSDPSVAPALTFASSDVEVRYSTMRRGFNAGSPVVQCAGGNFVLVDGIVVNETPAGGMELSCPGASVVTSALETTNDASPWFDGVASGNFDLTPAGEAQFSNIAEWNTGDPPTDIDGSPRPTVDGTPDVAGAHLP